MELIRFSVAAFLLFVLTCFFAAVGGSMVYLYSRNLWALRSRRAYKEFVLRQAATLAAQRQRQQRREAERIRLGKISWAGVCLGCLTLIYFGIFAGIFGARVYDQMRARDWSQTECVGISASSKRFKYAKSAAVFEPKIVYRYQFGAQVYAGDKFDFNETVFAANEIGAVLAKYQPNTTFACYVNPARPQESVVVRLLELVVIRNNSLFFAAVGAFVVFLFWSSLPRGRQQ